MFSGDVAGVIHTDWRFRGCGCWCAEDKWQWETMDGKICFVSLVCFLTPVRLNVVSLTNKNAVSPVSEPAAFEEDVAATNCFYLTWLCTPVRERSGVKKNTDGSREAYYMCEQQWMTDNVRVLRLGPYTTKEEVTSKCTISKACWMLKAKPPVSRTFITRWCQTTCIHLVCVW